MISDISKQLEDAGFVVSSSFVRSGVMHIEYSKAGISYPLSFDTTLAGKTALTLRSGYNH